jgi:hypothetical protein
VSLKLKRGRPPVIVVDSTAGISPPPVRGGPGRICVPLMS